MHPVSPPSSKLPQRQRPHSKSPPQPRRGTWAPISNDGVERECACRRGSSLESQTNDGTTLALLKRNNETARVTSRSPILSPTTTKPSAKFTMAGFVSPVKPRSTLAAAKPKADFPTTKRRSLPGKKVRAVPIGGASEGKHSRRLTWHQQQQRNGAINAAHVSFWGLDDDVGADDESSVYSSDSGPEVKSFRAAPRTTNISAPEEQCEKEVAKEPPSDGSVPWQTVWASDDSFASLFSTVTPLSTTFSRPSLTRSNSESFVVHKMSPQRSALDWLKHSAPVKPVRRASAVTKDASRHPNPRFAAVSAQERNLDSAAATPAESKNAKAFIPQSAEQAQKKNQDVSASSPSCRPVFLRANSESFALTKCSANTDDAVVSPHAVTGKDLGLRRASYHGPISTRVTSRRGSGPPRPDGRSRRRNSAGHHSRSSSKSSRPIRAQRDPNDQTASRQSSIGSEHATKSRGRTIESPAPRKKPQANDATRKSKADRSSSYRSPKRRSPTSEASRPVLIRSPRDPLNNSHHGGGSRRKQSPKSASRPTLRPAGAPETTTEPRAQSPKQNGQSVSRSSSVEYSMEGDDNEFMVTVTDKALPAGSRGKILDHKDPKARRRYSTAGGHSTRTDASGRPSVAGKAGKKAPVGRRRSHHGPSFCHPTTRAVVEAVGSAEGGGVRETKPGENRGKRDANKGGSSFADTKQVSLRRHNSASRVANIDHVGTLADSTTTRKKSHIVHCERQKRQSLDSSSHGETGKSNRRRSSPKLADEFSAMSTEQRGDCPPFWELKPGLILTRSRSEDVLLSTSSVKQDSVGSLECRWAETIEEANLGPTEQHPPNRNVVTEDFIWQTLLRSLPVGGDDGGCIPSHSMH